MRSSINTTPLHAREASTLCPFLGFGLGLRKEHYEAVLTERPAVDWFEVLTENYMVPGGKPLHYIDRIRAQYPIAMHGVSLSIGGSSPLNYDYLRTLQALIQRVEPCWVSDHLCWTAIDRTNLHDLLPLPYTEAAMRHVVQRIRIVQDFLGQRILLENVSSYLSYRDADMTEWEFLTAVAEAADCLILLDVNNVFVSAFNHEFDAHAYLAGLPARRIGQIHLAGHRDLGDYRIDTHDEAIIDEVWNLYAEAIQRFGLVSTMIERDDNIPPLDAMVAELGHARRLAAGIAPDALVG